MVKRIILFATTVILFGFTGHETSQEITYSSTLSCVSPEQYVANFVETNMSVYQEQENDVEDNTNLPGMRNLQLALARICVSEAGFQTRTDDCVMIYHALRNRSSTGQLTIGIMRAYAPLSFNTERTDNHRWVAHLNERFTEPQGWSEVVPFSWGAKRNDWIRVYNLAGEIIRRNPVPPCELRVDHWGAPGFRRQMHLRNGWTLLECGDTLNDFWSLPVRVQAETESNELDLVMEIGNPKEENELIREDNCSENEQICS
jgi:hypothetical protein